MIFRKNKKKCEELLDENHRLQDHLRLREMEVEELKRQLKEISIQAPKIQEILKLISALHGLGLGMMEFRLVPPESFFLQRP